MKFFPAICPQCNGELQIPEELEFVKCIYCGVDIKVREVLSIKQIININNILELGFSQIESQDFDGANQNFQKILENDIHNYKAWLGLGYAIEGLNNEYKVSDPTKYFEKAIHNSKDKREVILLILQRYSNYISYCREFQYFFYNLLDSFLKENRNCYEIWILKADTFYFHSLNSDSMLEQMKLYIKCYLNAIELAPKDIIIELKIKISKLIWRKLNRIFDYFKTGYYWIDKKYYDWLLETVEWIYSLDINNTIWKEQIIKLCNDSLKNKILNRKFYKDKLKKYSS
jgi:hypothetical protein